MLSMASGMKEFVQKTIRVRSLPPTVGKEVKEFTMRMNLKHDIVSRYTHEWYVSETREFV